MRKIGLMGGTFDPIHLAHIEIAKAAKEQYCLDEVIFMTSGNPPHKKGQNVTDAKTRLEMVRIAIDGIEGCSASDYEVNKAEYSYSVNTLKWMRAEYPDAQIYFLIGEDSLDYIDKWYRPQEILDLCTVLVYPRISMETLKRTLIEKQSVLGGDIRIIDAPVYGVSSTQIRNVIGGGADASGLLDRRVYEYIRHNNLYGSE